MEENILASSSTERIPLESPWVRKLVISKFIIYLVFVGVCTFFRIIVDLQRCANFGCKTLDRIPPPTLTSCMTYSISLSLSAMD